MQLFHGSPELFRHFSLTNAGNHTGIKFGYGIYLTESEASAVHYSQPRHQPFAEHHFLYTVEITDLTPKNHIISTKEVNQYIVAEVEKKLNMQVPKSVTQQGKLFRKWIGKTLTGNTDIGLAEEKAAAELLDNIGVHFMVWPQAQTKPDGLINCAVFNPNNVHIVKIEQIEITEKNGKYILINGSKKEI